MKKVFQKHLEQKTNYKFVFQEVRDDVPQESAEKNEQPIDTKKQTEKQDRIKKNIQKIRETEKKEVLQKDSDADHLVDLLFFEELNLEEIAAKTPEEIEQIFVTFSDKKIKISEISSKKKEELSDFLRNLIAQLEFDYKTLVRGTKEQKNDGKTRRKNRKILPNLIWKLLKLSKDLSFAGGNPLVISYQATDTTGIFKNITKKVDVSVGLESQNQNEDLQKTQFLDYSDDPYKGQKNSTIEQGITDVPFEEVSEYLHDSKYRKNYLEYKTMENKRAEVYKQFSNIESELLKAERQKNKAYEAYQEAHNDWLIENPEIKALSEEKHLENKYYSLLNSWRNNSTGKELWEKLIKAKAWHQKIEPAYLDLKKINRKSYKDLYKIEEKIKSKYGSIYKMETGVVKKVLLRKLILEEFSYKAFDIYFSQYVLDFSELKDLAKEMQKAPEKMKLYFLKHVNGKLYENYDKSVFWDTDAFKKNNSDTLIKKMFERDTKKRGAEKNEAEGIGGVCTHISNTVVELAQNLGFPDAKSVKVGTDALVHWTAFIQSENGEWVFLDDRRITKAKDNLVYTKYKTLDLATEQYIRTVGQVARGATFGIDGNHQQTYKTRTYQEKENWIRGLKDGSGEVGEARKETKEWYNLPDNTKLSINNYNQEFSSEKNGMLISLMHKNYKNVPEISYEDFVAGKWEKTKINNPFMKQKATIGASYEKYKKTNTKDGKDQESFQISLKHDIYNRIPVFKTQKQALEVQSFLSNLLQINAQSVIGQIGQGVGLNDFVQTWGTGIGYTYFNPDNKNEFFVNVGVHGESSVNSEEVFLAPGIFKLDPHVNGVNFSAGTKLIGKKGTLFSAEVSGEQYDDLLYIRGNLNVQTKKFGGVNISAQKTFDNSRLQNMANQNLSLHAQYNAPTFNVRSTPVDAGVYISKTPVNNQSVGVFVKLSPKSLKKIFSR